MPSATTADRFTVTHVDHNGAGVYQVRDTVSGRVRSCYIFEKCAVAKAAQLNREEG